MVTCSFIVPSIRPALMRTFLQTLSETPALDDWLVVCLAQEWTDRDRAEAQAIAGDRLCIVNAMPEDPVYPLRADVMREFRDTVDVWCNADDDMEFLPGLTDYTAAVERVLDPDVGVVSANWVRSEAFLTEKRMPKAEWITQPFTNTAGGMLYSNRVAAILLDNPCCPVLPYLFEDVQVGLTCYVNGLTNYRYRGSLLIHRILTPGGMKRMMSRRELAPPDPRLITLRPSKPVYETDNNWMMPVTSDVTRGARALHDENRRRRQAGEPLATLEWITENQ